METSAVPSRQIVTPLRNFLLTLILGVTPCAAFATPVATSAPASTGSPVLEGTKKPSEPLDITELKIQMAEVSLKVTRSDRSINSLISSLEEYLNLKCFPGLSETLTYKGPPTDPGCLERMNQLLAFNPDNPAAICVRDGIEAQSCLLAYKNQQLVEFYDSESLVADLPDTSLKVGLTAAEYERIDVQHDMLEDINDKYQKAETDEDKAKYMKDAVGVYDQLLNTACRLVSLRVRRLDQGEAEKQDSPRAAEMRKKLLLIPKNLRADYQNRERLKAEEELALAKNDEYKKREVTELLAVIDQPERPQEEALSNLQRSRLVLRPCFQAIGQAKQSIPLLPAPICYTWGWQTPQCVSSIKAWRVAKEKERKALSVKPGATPTPQSIISSF
jgi:hypothetical protein